MNTVNSKSNEWKHVIFGEPCSTNTDIALYCTEDEGWLAETAQIVPSHAHATVAQIQLLRAILSLRELLLLN